MGAPFAGTSPSEVAGETVDPQPGDRYRELVGTVLLAATPDDPEVPGRWTLVARDVLSVVMEEDDAGLLTPLFTSPAALARWRPEGGCYVERDAAWHFGVAASNPSGRVVIDPGSPASVVLEPAEVAALADGRVPGAGGQVLLATPLDPLPDDVAAAVRAALAAEPAVRSARLFLVDETGGGPQPVVLVDLAADLADEVMGRVVVAVADRAPGAGGLRFGLVGDDLRAAYESGGLPLFA